MKKMDLTISEPLLNLDNDPAGNNTNKSYAAFYQKKLYEIKAFNQGETSSIGPINILYEKLFYGRVNLNNEAVITNNAKIKSFNASNGKEYKLANFTLDAYRDFVSYWDSLKRINKLSKNSKLYNIGITSNYIGPGKLYFYYMSSVFDRVKNRINSKNITIKNLNDFIKEFVDYVETITPSIPINFSTFVRSRMADPLISGLCFDVNVSDLTDDSIKYNQFLQDPNYAIFQKSASKFGFVPDKHIPWRLYADIDSPTMKSYMNRYNLNQDNLYQTNYVLADLYDLELLRFYVIQFYNTYIAGKQTFRDNKFKICDITNNTIVESKEYKIDFIDLEKIKYDLDFDRQIMKLYIYIKVCENNYSWDQSKFANILQNFIQIKEALDTTKAMMYVRPLFLHSAIAEYKQKNIIFS